jgi:hypothetical protein
LLAQCLEHFSQRPDTTILLQFLSISIMLNVAEMAGFQAFAFNDRPANAHEIVLGVPAAVADACPLGAGFSEPFSGRISAA